MRLWCKWFGHQLGKVGYNGARQCQRCGWWVFQTPRPDIVIKLGLVLIMLILTACTHLSDEAFLALAWNERDLYLKHQIETTQKVCYTGLVVTGAAAATGIVLGVQAIHGVKVLGTAMGGN